MWKSSSQRCLPQAQGRLAIMSAVRGKVGQFRPLAGATPFIGTIDTLEHIAEYKVEMVCAEAYLQDAVALKQNHPYQEPAYDVIQMINI